MGLGCYRHRPPTICDTFASHVQNKQVLQRTHAPSRQCSPQLGSSKNLAAACSLLAFAAQRKIIAVSVWVGFRRFHCFRCFCCFGKPPFTLQLHFLLIVDYLKLGISMSRREGEAVERRMAGGGEGWRNRVGMHSEWKRRTASRSEGRRAAAKD